MIRRSPTTGAWYKGGLWHDNMKTTFPDSGSSRGTTIGGTYLAAYNHVRRLPGPDRYQQYAVIAPTLHCAYKRATENTDCR